MISEKSTVKEINKEVRNSPYYKKFNTRRYRSPKGYSDYEQVIFKCARELYIYITYFSVEILSSNFTHSNSLAILLSTYLKDFKTFYLDKKLLDAFIKTKPPADTTKLKRIVPNGLILFPQGIIIPNTNSKVKWIMFRHSLVGEVIESYPLSQGGSFGTVLNTHNYLSWFTILDDELNTQYTKNIKLTENYRDDPSYYKYIYDPTIGVNDQIGFTETEGDIVNLITDVLIQTILYLQTNEDTIIEKAKSDRQIGFGKNNKGRITPVIIGEGFTPKYIGEVGTNKSSNKSTHWRRGHYRWQPYGSKDNPEYKSIWIEPTLINAEVNND